MSVVRRCDRAATTFFSRERSTGPLCFGSTGDYSDYGWSLTQGSSNPLKSLLSIATVAVRTLHGSTRAYSDGRCRSHSPNIELYSDGRGSAAIRWYKMGVENVQKLKLNTAMLRPLSSVATKPANVLPFRSDGQLASWAAFHESCSV